jgi:hypothetical protein
VLLGAVVAVATIAAAVFIGVAIHEIGYASKHPYGYGPAHVIAWAAGAGALLAGSVGALAVALTRAARTSP